MYEFVSQDTKNCYHRENRCGDEAAEMGTAEDDDGCVFTICLAYGSRGRSSKLFVAFTEDHAAGEISLEDINQTSISI